MSILTAEHVHAEDKRQACTCRIKVWYQTKPYAAWVLKVSVRDPVTGNTATARTWLDQYNELKRPPPYSVTGPIARGLRATAELALTLTP